MLPTTDQRCRRDSWRNGTIGLFAALGFHVTAAYGSWRNLVERMCSALTTKKVQPASQRTGVTYSLEFTIEDTVQR